MEVFPKLINTHDNSAINITNKSFSLGRSLSCDHVIQSLGVSRFHCIIKKIDDDWYLFDRSSNGTLVNKDLIKFNENTVIKNGDMIRLGPGNLEYFFSAAKDEIPEAVTEEIILADVIEELQQPFDVETPKSPLKPDTTNNKTNDEQNENYSIMENELTCSICSELFIKAVTLNCSHTFCKYCIDEWRKNKSTCPICRKHIMNQSPTLVLDNFIEKIINKQSSDIQECRKLIIKQREELVGNTASSSNIREDHADVIEIYSDDEDEEDDSDYNYLSDDQDYDDYYDGSFISRGYYGGYGRCFICNQSGHWANSCPFKNR